LSSGSFHKNIISQTSQKRLESFQMESEYVFVNLLLYC
jgi:hypothetical protein